MHQHRAHRSHCIYVAHVRLRAAAYLVATGGLWHSTTRLRTFLAIAGAAGWPITHRDRPGRTRWTAHGPGPLRIWITLPADGDTVYLTRRAPKRRSTP